LLYATIFHLLAGMVTGSLFKVRTLALLLGFVLIEALGLALMQGGIAFLWAVVLLVAIQVGYFAGLYSRRVLEDAGYSLPIVRTRRTP
jgi:hypothetical protein